MPIPGYKTQVSNRHGLFTVVEENSHGMQFVHMEYLRLHDGQTVCLENPRRELCASLICGAGTVRFGGITEKIDGRTDLFDGLPHAVYIPPATRVEITANGYFEAVVWGTPAEPKGRVEIIRPDDIKVLHIGEGNWEIDGYFLIGSDFPAQTLIVGETQIPEGHWCSFPPHSHDKDIPGRESLLEEIYYFRFSPECGFGFQGLYNDDRSLDEGYIIRNREVVTVPNGYHPNAAAPGYRMRMYWGMGGLERDWIPYEDPDHAWIGNGANPPSSLNW